MGVISLLIFCGKQIEAFCRRETIAAFIIAGVIVLMAAGWIYTFTHERQAVVFAQHKADSISYRLERYLQVYDSSSTVVINGDTIRHGK
jgi:myosin-crossreactive antigen